MKRSIRVRFTCLFFSVIALVVMTALCMNNFGLERFSTFSTLAMIFSSCGGVTCAPSAQ